MLARRTPACIERSVDWLAVALAGRLLRQTGLYAEREALPLPIRVVDGDGQCELAVRGGFDEQVLGAHVTPLGFAGLDVLVEVTTCIRWRVGNVSRSFEAYADHAQQPLLTSFARLRAKPRHPGRRPGRKRQRRRLPVFIRVIEQRCLARTYASSDRLELAKLDPVGLALLRGICSRQPPR